jgi:uncharacterized MAPEG superfamily protein
LQELKISTFLLAKGKDLGEQFHDPRSITTTMSSLPTLLGLSSTSPNLTPYHLIFNFLLSYVFLSARLLKMYLKLDHNVSPRADLTKYGERAVADKKITRSQLLLLQRNESCHANSMEHFPVFVAAVIMATIAGVTGEVVNWWCLVYGVSRCIYAFAYLRVERSLAGSYVRSLAWWASSIACLRLLWLSAKCLEQKAGLGELITGVEGLGVSIGELAALVEENARKQSRNASGWSKVFG